MRTATVDLDRVAAVNGSEKRTHRVLFSEISLLGHRAATRRPSRAAVRTVPGLLGLEFDVYASRQIEVHERVHRLRRRLQNVDEPLVRAHLEVFAALFIDVR